MTMRLDKKALKEIKWAMRKKITNEEFLRVANKTNRMWEIEEKEIKELRQKRWMKLMNRLSNREFLVYKYIERLRHLYD